MVNVWCVKMWNNVQWFHQVRTMFYKDRVLSIQNTLFMLLQYVILTFLLWNTILDHIKLCSRFVTLIRSKTYWLIYVLLTQLKVVTDLFVSFLSVVTNSSDDPIKHNCMHNVADVTVVWLGLMVKRWGYLHRKYKLSCHILSKFIAIVLQTSNIPKFK